MLCADVMRRRPWRSLAARACVAFVLALQERIVMLPMACPFVARQWAVEAAL